MYTCVYLCVGIHMSADACGGQKKVLDPLKLELQSNCEPPDTGAGNWTWVFHRTASVYNHGAIFPAPSFYFYKEHWWITLSLQNFLLSTDEWVNKK